MNSCIYEGRVKHARVLPRAHAFEYRLFMMYLDLDELPALFNKRWLWSVEKPAIARFRREQHLGPAQKSLSEAVRDVVHEETGQRPSGAIRLLTNMSYFGYCFNPVSFYYCFAADNTTLQFIVAEVNNTPWGERQSYVMPCVGPADGPWRFSPKKKMHVSPFMPMEIEYAWLLSLPTEQLSIHMSSKQDGDSIFSASMRLEHKQISASALSSVLVRFPFMTLKIMIAIHWQALRLWIKRIPLYAHPDKNNKANAL